MENTKIVCLLITGKKNKCNLELSNPNLEPSGRNLKILNNHV